MFEEGLADITQISSAVLNCFSELYIWNEFFSHLNFAFEKHEVSWPEVDPRSPSSNTVPLTSVLRNIDGKMLLVRRKLSHSLSISRDTHHYVLWTEPQLSFRSRWAYCAAFFLNMVNFTVRNKENGHLTSQLMEEGGWGAVSVVVYMYSNYVPFIVENAHSVIINQPP